MALENSFPKLLWLAVPLCWSWGASAAPAQTSSLRKSGGWTATAQVQPAATSSEAQPAAVQTAFFQSPGAFSDRLPPPLPSDGFGNGSPGNTINQTLPPYQGFPVNNGSSEFVPAAPPNNPYGSPYPLPPGPSQNPMFSQSSASSQNSATPPNLRTSSDVLPPPSLPMPARNQPLSQATPARGGSGELRAIQGAASPASQPLPQLGQLDPRTGAQDIATGLPYVTPPPRSRYATSPYQPAVFQTAAYQTNIPQSQNTQSQNSSGPRATVPTYLTAQQSALPQFQLTQYQQLQNQQPQFVQTQAIAQPMAYPCTAPAPSFPSTGAVPGGFIPPTLPPNLAPGMYTPSNAGYTPAFSLGQENYNVLLGRGIIGQPTVYVPGQPVRNFMRYLSP